MNMIMSVIVCFFAVYGVFKLLYGCVYYYYDVKKIKPKFSHQIIAVNDESENLEAYLRAAKMKEEEDIIILDYSNNQENKKILKLMEIEFPNVILMTPEEYKDYVYTAL